MMRFHKPGLALLAGLFHADGLPDLALAAARLDHAGGVTEAGEAEGDVFTHECVCIVSTHGGFFASRLSFGRVRFV